MYRRPRFLETLIDIRQEMAREADYDADLFAEMVRSGRERTPAIEAKSQPPARERSSRKVPKRAA